MFEDEERVLLVRLNSSREDSTLSYYWYPKRRTLRYERYLNDDIIETFKTSKELKSFVKFDIFDRYDWNNNDFFWQVEYGESFIGDKLNINIYAR